LVSGTSERFVVNHWSRRSFASEIVVLTVESRSLEGFWGFPPSSYPY